MDQRGPAWRKWALLRHDMTCARWLHRCAMLHHAATCCVMLRHAASCCALHKRLAELGCDAVAQRVATQVQPDNENSTTSTRLVTRHKKHMMPRCDGANETARGKGLCTDCALSGTGLCEALQIPQTFTKETALAKMQYGA